MLYARGVADPTPTPVTDIPTAKMRLERTAGEEPPEEDNPVPRPGMITTASQVARQVRDTVTDETPAEGTKVRRKPAGSGEPPKRRRPGWVGLLAVVLTMGPGWTEVRKLLEAADSAGEMGELRGVQAEQGRQIRDLNLKISANTAADLEGSFNGALEFRHLDKNITALSRNIDRLLVAMGVPEADRARLAETPTEITDRHDAQIRQYREAKARAEREALERSIATSDTVGP